ncbi:hypothetical protein KCU98_g956, partial [Aureobasidium melanogenum]
MSLPENTKDYSRFSTKPRAKQFPPPNTCPAKPLDTSHSQVDSTGEAMSLLENDSGDDGEVRHKRFDYNAPSLAGITEFFETDDISDVKAAILLNQTPQEIHQMKKHIRCYLRAPCPWIAPRNLLDNAGKTLCSKDDHPLGWMMPVGRQGVLFRHLVIPPVAKLYPDLFAEPDLETQIRQDQPNAYGRFTQAPFVVCREVLIRMIEACAQEMRDHPCLRDADTETQHISPRPNLKRSRLDGFETTETEVEPKPKRQMVKQLGFTHVKTVVSLRPSDLPKRTKSANAPSESVKSKPAIESIRRGPSTVAELLEQERAVRAQSRDAPSSPISPTKDKKNSMPSTTSNEHTPTHSERLDRAIVERRRLYIHKMIPWTKKRNVADFFIGYNVGAITMYVSGAESKSCSADFYTCEQAKRAMEDLHRTPLLGRVVDIEIAKSSLRMDEEEKEKHPLPVKPAARLSSTR